MKKILKWLAPVTVGLAVISSAYGLVTLPYTFTAGQSIEASKVNANDQALRDGINSHLQATNPHNTTLAQILAVGNSAGVNAINFNGVPSQNFLVQNVTADPTCNGGATGKLIYNTIDSLFKICNGSSFVSIAGTGVNTLASVLSAGNSASSYNIDLNSNQLLNTRIENRTSDGASVLAGRVFMRTDTGDFKVCNGTSCTALGGAQGLSSVLGVSNSAGSTNIDFNGNQAVKLRMEVLASDPGSSYSGRVYYNSVDNNLKYYDAGTSSFRTIGNTNTLAQTLTNGNSAGSTNIDLNNNQMLKFRVENLSGTPGTGNAGRMYYDTTSTKLMYAESATNRAVVAEDKTQTLTNKSMSGSSNTFTNIPDSALSANVLLADGVQTVTGAKTFNTGKITVADISTPSGGKHILTDGLANDTITLNNAVQTLNGKTLGASSFTGNVNFTQHQLVNARAENRGTDPAPGNAGRIFFKTATGEMAYDDGTNIRVLTANAGGSTTPWILGGNALIDDTTDFLGTTDSQDLKLISGGTNLLTLDKTGDVILPTIVDGILHSDATGILSASAIVDADIDPAAAIDATKIADGSVTSTEFQYINTLSSNAQTQLNLKAPLASPALTGNPTAPTQSPLDSSTKIATTKYVDDAIAASPGGVTSVFSRTGDVVSANGDYTASQVTNVPAGNIAAVTVQSALAELDAEKQPLDADLTSIAANATDGLLAHTAAGTYTARSIAGASGQITVTNSNGVSGNPNIAISDNAVFPGTGSNTLAMGTTAQRSGSPTGGMIRYNTDLSQFEGYTTAWGAIAGSGGLTNFITSSDGNSLSGWANFADAAAATPVDGTGGSPVTALATSTSSPLVGTSSFTWVKSANNRQGEGFSYDFTIDSAYQAKAMTISFMYQISSGTFADNDMTVWIYDKTNSVLIQPSAYQIKNSGTIEQAKMEFQTSSNSTSYRVLFYTASTSASAYTVKLDDIKVSPNTYSTGASTTDWAAYTPTITGLGTVTSLNFVSRRVGDSLQVIGYGISGTSAGSLVSISLPSASVDSSKITLGNTTSNPGTVIGTWTGNATGHVGYVVTATGTSTSVVYFGNGGSTPILTPQNGSTIIGSSESFSVNFTVPIAGWGTSQVLSSDTSSAVVSFSGALSANQAVTADVTTIKLNSNVVDKNGSWNSTTGIYTVAVPGEYKMGLTSLTAASSGTIYVKRTGVSPTLTKYLSQTSNAVIYSGSQSFSCVAGDQLSFLSDSTLTIVGGVSGTGIYYTSGYIDRQAGPAQIAASEKVYLQYTGNAGTVLTANVTNADFSTKVTDSHSAWNGTTFTAPRPGFFTLTGYISFSTAGLRDIYIYVNGSKKYLVGAGSAGNATNIYPLAGGVYLNAGDSLTLRSDAAGTLNNNANDHHIEITSQGN